MSMPAILRRPTSTIFTPGLVNSTLPPDPAARSDDDRPAFNRAHNRGASVTAERGRTGISARSCMTISCLADGIGGSRAADIRLIGSAHLLGVLNSHAAVSAVFVSHPRHDEGGHERLHCALARGRTSVADEGGPPRRPRRGSRWPEAPRSRSPWEDPGGRDGARRVIICGQGAVEHADWTASMTGLVAGGGGNARTAHIHPGLARGLMMAA